MATILGIVLIITAVILFLVRTLSIQKRLDQLAASSRKKLGEIVDTYMEMKKDLGELGEENTTSEQMTVMGMPCCETPLMSPLGNKPCLYYSFKVSASRVERYQEQDSDGKTTTNTRRYTDVLDQGSNSTRFVLDDGTGKIAVDPRDGKFEGLTKTVDRSDTQFNMSGNTLSLGSFSFSLQSGNQRPDTIKYEESIIGLDRKVTVIGTMSDKMGDLIIEKDAKTPVIVSTLSQDEMIRNAQSKSQKFAIGAAACAVAGVVLMIIGII